MSKLRLVFDALMLIGGIILLALGFRDDILWMILAGGVMIAIATGWFIYIRRHRDNSDNDCSAAASEGGFWIGVIDSVADGFRHFF